MPIPKLKPFWYTPEFGNPEGISFRLRPLTQEQLVDVEAHYDDSGGMTQKARYVAGRLGIIDAKGLVDDDGQELTFQQAGPLIDRNLVRWCGWRLLAEDQGIDWERLVRIVNGEDVPEEQPEEDPQGNSPSQP